jgi:hypothetical protein
MSRPSRQTQLYQLQLRLEGFSDLPRLTAGYTLDALQTALEGMYVTLQVGRKVQYVIDLSRGVGQQLLSFQQPVAPPYRKRRVSPKKGGKKDADICTE